ncbi:HPF/RaiA family ribosome-associated protein [Noviherbaspirillum sp.]|uniref:HPF/RaiA family ribosome-associated protein n=1 Tax=Noviherbaspirillum sp. TaxID=1926288 RepID=UPI0039C8DC30
MQFDIRSESFELTTALHRYARRRLDFALSRFLPNLDNVCVRLIDENGPRGGIDKRCQVRLRLQGISEVIINTVATDLYVAIDRAADRAGNTVARRWARYKQSMRARMLPPHRSIEYVLAQ